MAAVQVEVPRLPGPPGQPDIDYAPDLEKYKRRTQRRLQTEELPRTLPPGFPEKLDSPLAWDGATVGDHYQWNYELTPSDIEEIEQALRHFQSLNKPLGFISQETFPLSRLHDTLRDISREIHTGYGFKVVRGVPVDAHTREENIIIYAGLSAHVGPVRARQDQRTRPDDGAQEDVVLAHIRDLTATVDARAIGAPAYTSEEQVFHTDIGDVIALFALGTAAQGGESYLSSSWAVYNELAATRPDLIRTLAEPWDADEFGKQGRKYTSRPLLHHQPATATTPERLIIQYARRIFTGYWGLPRSADIPPITEAQAEALDALHFLGQKHAVALNFRKGDIQYVNNLSIFHARGAFVDDEKNHRHLVRLWLRDPEYAWETPAALQDRWDRIYKDVTPENSVFPLEPSIRSASEGTGKQSNGVTSA